MLCAMQSSQLYLLIGSLGATLSRPQSSSTAMKPLENRMIGEYYRNLCLSESRAASLSDPRLTGVFAALHLVVTINITVLFLSGNVLHSRQTSHSDRILPLPKVVIMQNVWSELVKAFNSETKYRFAYQFHIALHEKINCSNVCGNPANPCASV